MAAFGGTMAGRFLVHETRVKGPATHALLIGVGAYPHLNGGKKQLTRDHEKMEQLTSPPLSARQLATWLIESFEHSDKPLATVSLLVSEARPAPFVNPATGKRTNKLELADLNSVTLAIYEWLGRGNSDPDNLMIFYFCGHGMADGDNTALLLSDYGANPRTSLDGAIDFRSLRLGMQRDCMATEQCFIVDACRTEAETLKKAKSSGRIVVQPGTRDPAWPDIKSAPVFYSAMAGKQAYSLPKSPSIYTKALLDSLQGFAAEKTPGQWRVNTQRLGQAIDHLVQRRALGIKRVATPTAEQPTSIPLNTLPGLPNAMVYVTTNPADRLSTLSLSYTCPPDNGAPKPVRPARPVGSKDREMVLELETGTYKFVGQLGRRAVVHSEYIYPYANDINFR
jgi:hypothetical protein